MGTSPTSSWGTGATAGGTAVSVLVADGTDDADVAPSAPDVQADRPAAVTR
jgi:hypothetical protein